jgi:hypothetical protein
MASQSENFDDIVTEAQQSLSEPAQDRWVFKATVYKGPKSKGFVGFGDASPRNVSVTFAGSEMRIAETRAVNRALRKAYGVGICSLEELGSVSSATGSPDDAKVSPVQLEHKHTASDPITLRDRLCVLIRKHDLDPELVKRYAASFCGTETLRNASRDLVEMFIGSLANQAESDRDALLCKLNGFGSLSEVKS